MVHDERDRLRCRRLIVHEVANPVRPTLLGAWLGQLDVVARGPDGRSPTQRQGLDAARALLRHSAQNYDAMASDACGSVEPRWLHPLKHEATGRSVCHSRGVPAFAPLLNSAVSAAASQRTSPRRDTPRNVRVGSRSAPATPIHASDPSEPAGLPPSTTAGRDHGVHIVAAVAVLGQEEWATLLQMLPFGVDRWRFVALPDPAAGLDDLVVIGVNGTVGQLG
jgi:hypothetical protein